MTNLFLDIFRLSTIYRRGKANYTQENVLNPERSAADLIRMIDNQRYSIVNEWTIETSDSSFVENRQRDVDFMAIQNWILGSFKRQQTMNEAIQEMRNAISLHLEDEQKYYLDILDNFIDKNKTYLEEAGDHRFSSQTGLRGQEYS